MKSGPASGIPYPDSSAPGKPQPPFMARRICTRCGQPAELRGSKRLPKFIGPCCVTR